MSLTGGRGKVNLKAVKDTFPVRGVRMTVGGFAGTG